MIIPTVGQRFLMSGAEFEIAYVAPENLRCTSVAGGKQFEIPTKRIQSLLEKETIKLIGRISTDETQPDDLSPVDIKIMNYRLDYARHIFLSTTYHGSKKLVEPLIKEVANANKDSNPPSFSTCRRWVNSYKSSNKNPISLIPKYANCGNRTARFDTEIDSLIHQHISEDYLLKQRLKTTSVHSNIVGDAVEKGLEDLPLPSVRTIQRRVKEIDPYLSVKSREGIYQANRRFKAAGQSYIARRILEAVEADGNLLDVLVVDPDTGEIMGRPYGTCLIDKYSRCILGFKITMIPFSAATLLSTLSSALSEDNNKISGLFETLIVDNGSDFLSDSVRNFCNNMGIRIEYGPPRNPDSKPHVERFFKTLNTELIHNLPGTTFSSPIHRRDYNSKDYACFTLEKLQELVERWLDIYHRKTHRGHGRSPEKLWEESLKDNPTMTYPSDHLVTIAREVEFRNIVKGRVTIDGLQWYSHTLATLAETLKIKKQSTKVEVYLDSLDLSTVYVKDPNNKKVIITCDSTKPDYTKGLSLYEHKQIIEELKSKGKKDLKSYGEYALQVMRWELWQDINESGKQFAKKKIARLKELKKKQKENKKFVKLEKKKRAEKETKRILKSKKNKANKLNKTSKSIPSRQKHIEEPSCPDESDFYEFKRFDSNE